ncbi:trypsin-like peptidase domain-containing protein [Streptomyces sp. P38-E01]|uniref:Trypsin-like peptidase domain-containing protein n=1 Tax=Streptomyces tardus TaxID=2780544 RepID=A0A949JI04_9ACTN|nr:trypsin-like peptidase domain-containing protein [Streptomyces tardus]MBU7599233.1 trypsin-like peptidase domain-containing protein [Streptomyces tardus]
MDESSGSEPRPKWWNRPRRDAGSDDAIVGATGEVSAHDAAGGPAESAEVPSQGPGAGQSRAPAATPLHPEDPYGTPPYGGPGPWALAPPVQHPRAQTTPAHGVSVPPPGPRGRTLLVGALLVALLAGAVGGAVGMYVERNGGFGRVSLSQPAGEGGDRPKDSVAGIAAATLPGVVTLHVRGGSGQSTGTGFVLDDKGHILTNHHVVRSAAQGGRIGVTFNGGETVRGRLIGGDGGYDLAVVKVDRVDGLRPLPLGNSEAVQVGDPVVAIGSPFDLAGTVTTGIISAKERPVTAGGRGDGTDISYVNALQTDAPINPGNSGGPLVDTRGRVVGVNTAIRSGEGGRGGADEQGGGSVGLGFAIPVNQAKRVAEELINDGRATHPVIGVSVDIADQSEEGARVGGGEGDQPGVVPGGPADDAGMKEGDLITAVDSARVRSGEELIVKIRSHKPGDELELTVERGGKERSVKVTLGSGSSE